MSLRSGYFKKSFEFGFKARTSRGFMQDKVSWFITLWDDKDPDSIGIGECGPLPGLSTDAVPDFEEVLKNVLAKISASALEVSGNMNALLKEHVPAKFSSILFGLETAWLDLINGGKRKLFDNSFITGSPIPINGLIWMGDLDFMLSQVNEKIANGFRCLKLKVGGLNFERECDILQYIRNRYYREDITIRLDANGAFKIDDVLYKLNELAQYNIHSIEQPLKPGTPETAALCRNSPIPIALDEELIGIHTKVSKHDLLDRLKPQFIILKPTLHGGLSGCREWIEIAEQLSIGWWITSALESNIGLNAICQFTANYNVNLPQGLGTGMIYTNNIESPLQVANGEIVYAKDLQWNAISDFMLR